MLWCIYLAQHQWDKGPPAGSSFSPPPPSKTVIRHHGVTEPGPRAAVMTTFDDILEEAGKFGRSQKRVFALLCLVSMPFAGVYVGIVFQGFTPEHWCRDPDMTQISERCGWTPLEARRFSVPRVNISAGAGHSQCEMYDKDWNNTIFICDDTEDGFSNVSDGVPITNCKYGWEYDYGGRKSFVTEVKFLALMVVVLCMCCVLRSTKSIRKFLKFRSVPNRLDQIILSSFIHFNTVIARVVGCPHDSTFQKSSHSFNACLFFKPSKFQLKESSHEFLPAHDVCAHCVHFMFQFDLVCANDWMVDMFQAAVNAGFLFGSIVVGYLADRCNCVLRMCRA